MSEAKEIESQARGHDKEVQSYYQSKQFDLDKSKLQGFDGKSKPYYGDHQTQRMSVFTRGRRRFEETTYVSAYISNHNRKPETNKPQCPVPDFGAGRKATGSEDDCIVSESDSSDDLLGKILCKLDEAHEKAKGLKKRVDEMMCKSEAGHTSSMLRTITRSRSDFTARVGKQHTLVQEEEEPSMMMAHTTTHKQREGTVQIGRQRISADHTEGLLLPQAPAFEVDGQFLYNSSSPDPYGGLIFPTIGDLLMDGDEYKGEADKEEIDHCFMKLMNEFGGETMPDEEEEDPRQLTKRHETFSPENITSHVYCSTSDNDKGLGLP
ncbi:unnamed protein product [Eruca vesicaria subsp. sativa]|uniref:Uncharacterized protein n=1 Tax=Eruca vesicaria subsp. sativa TaxID=29727 RepID=A0ABC8LP93_ERUVS|nr:unnamed protein product [Eruca vesicaria subsp. sativa]